MILAIQWLMICSCAGINETGIRSIAHAENTKVIACM